LVDSDVFATNTVTGEMYETVEQALAAAKSGETVKLLADSEANAFFVWGGITLDLNGYKLTSNGVAAMPEANIIDSSENSTGLLVVSEANFAYTRTNKQLIIKTDAGYRFADVELLGALVPAGNNYTFWVGLTDDTDSFVAELIKDSANASTELNLQFRVEISWTGANGTITQSFRFRDDIAQEFATVYLQNGANGAGLNMTIANATGLQDLTFRSQIVVLGADGEPVQTINGAAISPASN